MKVEDVEKRLAPKLLLSTADVAAALGVSAATLRAMIECGEIEAVNLAATTRSRPRWYIYRAEVLRLLQCRSSL